MQISHMSDLLTRKADCNTICSVWKTFTNPPQAQRNFARKVVTDARIVGTISVLFALFLCRVVSMLHGSP